MIFERFPYHFLNVYDVNNEPNVNIIDGLSEEKIA